ncbi:DUF7683 domain-containing protein [Denitrobaculum tricleocarpae]|uniref:DUF7683 domain-containing protein n=1 Tax=Denitrobaculum tricleocarpae TaxID=2591009 RepID=A0A545T831_9PROT|nr:hypothetical protein [Denitrobaculum tricleocarpae]TQV73371.1 hypothetical protein FKG95_25485 [Denitrobaculum tricleocarpae]
MPHVIRYFDKADESYAGKLELADIPLNKLQELFHTPPEDPMYECFPIHETQAKFFYEFAKIKLDIESYDYFLEYDA